MHARRGTSFAARHRMRRRRTDGPLWNVPLALFATGVVTLGAAAAVAIPAWHAAHRAPADRATITLGAGGPAAPFPGSPGTTSPAAPAAPEGVGGGPPALPDDGTGAYGQMRAPLAAPPAS